MPPVHADERNGPITHDAGHGAEAVGKEAGEFDLDM